MRLSPSLLSADFSALFEDARRVEPLVECFHWDVMDGHFVPNLTFGPPVVNSLRPRLSRPFDVHLMIDHPLQYAPQFKVREDDSIIFHVESDDDPSAVLDAIDAIPARAGITLRPGTLLEEIERFLDRTAIVLVMSVEPGFGGQTFLPEALERIRALRTMIGDRAIRIAVDGGIHPGNVAAVIASGADTIIAGSAIFAQPDPAEAIAAFRSAVE